MFFFLFILFLNVVRFSLFSGIMEGTSQPVDRQMEETPPPVRPPGQSLWSIQQRHNKVFNKEKYEKDKEKERIRIKILNKYKINFKNFVIYICLIHFNKSKKKKG